MKSQMQSKGQVRWVWLALLAGLVFFSAALVWHDLGAREVLGKDENATITKLDQPDLAAVLVVTRMKVTGQPGNMQPLYFLLHHLGWPLVQGNAFVFRFLPSAFGLLAVVLTFKLGEELLGRAAGWLGALLAALLPLHVEYSQVARPYTLLAALSLASAYFLLRGLRTNRWLPWAGFVLASALNVYTHYNALFVLAAEGLFAGAVWLVAWVEVSRKERSPGWLLRPALAFVLVGVLCVPGLVRLGQLAGDGLGGQVRVELTGQFFLRFLYRIGLKTPWLRGLLLGSAGLGLAATLWRRRWKPALFAGVWIALPFLILAVIKSPRPFDERYVIFVPPVAWLLAGEGLALLGRGVGRVGRRRGGATLRWTTVAIATAGLALLLLQPLRAYYAANRASDRLEQTLAVVERHARPGDVVVVSPRFFTPPLALNGAEARHLTKHLTLAEFESLLARYERVWVLYTSYLPPPELQEPLDVWIQARFDAFARVPIKAITALAYSNRVLTEPEAYWLDRSAILKDLAEVSADRQEAWLRHEELAQAYEALADVYDERGQSALAAEYRLQAEEARAAAPRPW